MGKDRRRPSRSWRLLVREELLHLVEEPFRDGRALLFRKAIELLQQVLLFSGELRRHLHGDPAELVAGAGPPEMRKALAAEPENVARLGAGRHLELLVPVQG